MPCLRAKPSAALVHAPLSSLAAETGGPTTCCSLSGPLIATFSTHTVRRRGVEKWCVPVKGRLASVSPSVTP